MNMDSMNPARELLSIFDTWESRTQTTAQRQVNLDDEEHQDEIVRAARCLEDIKVVLSYMASTTPFTTSKEAYQHAYTGWVQTVFHYPLNWQYERFNIRQRPMLTTLVDQINQLGKTTPVRMQWVEEHSELLQDKLRTVLQVLIEDDSLDAAFRAHAERLIVHVMELLKNLQTTSSFDLAEALLLLRTYMDSAIIRTSNERNREQYKWFARLIQNPLTNTLLGGVIGVATNLATRAIGM